ncbi:rod shape-determining protein RodA [Mucilaginibacter sp. PPCGB 2223]|uniref:rod shape-determining protein RodA n=1 Tax=Mucilaginibacter sp. PPCGB 2223 TaxID=1886027 RepID=UPI0008269FF9|nr:rod shape-determining protein RodA [Mucilaginibacter sp. PPCGB 2223]OCX52472.1 rod shape-determining protein RodA [Mucilaginibacter sp. PPCGB 2223]
MRTSNQRSFFFNVDWITVFIYLALCTIGWFNIHSAVYDDKYPSIIGLHTNYGKQLLFIIASISLATIILLLDSRFFSALTPFFYGMTVFLLLLVLVIGHNVMGNQAWISVGPLKLQPSEFAKYSTCLLLARYLSGVNIKVTEVKSFFAAAAIIFFPMALIKMQPDDGSTLVFCSLIFVLYREGLSSYFLIVGAMFIGLFILSLLFKTIFVVGGILIVFGIIIAIVRRNRKRALTALAGMILAIGFTFAVPFVYKHVIKEHQRVRIDEWLQLSTDLKKAGYNVHQSKIAIGSGKLWGKGYFKGTQTRFQFVPEQSTDFIFCTIGEEWGFAGSVVVIGLFVFLILRIILIAERQRAPFSRIYGYGVACIIFFHFFINIGLTIGIVPVIGIPLPFVSYGGSSLLSFTLLLFTLLKLDSNRMGIAGG